MTPATRFSRISHPGAQAVVAALVGLILLGLPMAARVTPLSPNSTSPDIQYYRSVVGAVRAGQPYASAAIDLLRARHAAVTPFFTIRPPFLTWLIADIPGGEGMADLLLAVLGGATMGAWLWRLSRFRRDGTYLVRAAVIFLASVGVTMGGHGVAYVHEAWAGLLVAASLALRSQSQFVLAVALGLAAALIRELAIPYLALMAAFAGLERRWAETGAFAAAAALAVAALAVHALRVETLTANGIAGAGGWIAFGGWSFVLETIRWSYLAVPWLGVALLPLALVGAIGWRNDTGARLATLLIGYTAGLLVAGRPDNFYWGLMITPLIGVGVALAPEAVFDLFRRAWPRSVNA